MAKKHTVDMDLFLKSEFLEIVTSMMEQDYGKKPIISRFHPIMSSNGNSVFYVITEEGNKFIVDLVGRKVQDDALLYWIENINHSGLLHEVFYERDLVILTFFRGEQFNNEYLSYFYVYGDRFPAIRFIPQDIYPNYNKMLVKRYKQQNITIPEDLLLKSITETETK